MKFNYTDWKIKNDANLYCMIYIISNTTLKYLAAQDVFGNWAFINMCIIKLYIQIKMQVDSYEIIIKLNWKINEF